MKKMAKRGKKPFNFDVEVLEKIEILAWRGLAQQDIAYCIGIHPTTLSEKKYESINTRCKSFRFRSCGIFYLAKSCEQIDVSCI